MKEFSHPGGNAREAVDINHAIDSTLIVCRNEWKYVAEMQTVFDEQLPLVPCFADQLNQAVLNMVINAAHALQARKKVQPELPGRITVSTRHDGDWAEIRITDNSNGIPQGIQQRIYDPFFTTKEGGPGHHLHRAFADQCLNRVLPGSMTAATTRTCGHFFLDKGQGKED